MGFDEAFDAFVRTRRGLPFWIELLNTPNCIPCLRFDDRETRLLPRSGLYNLTIDKDTRNGPTRSVLGILTPKCGKLGCIRHNPWIALSDARVIPGPLSASGIPLRDSRLVGPVFVFGALKKLMQWILSAASEATPIRTQKSVRVRPHEAFPIML